MPESVFVLDARDNAEQWVLQFFETSSRNYRV